MVLLSQNRTPSFSARQKSASLRGADRIFPLPDGFHTACTAASLEYNISEPFVTFEEYIEKIHAGQNTKNRLQSSDILEKKDKQ